MRWFGDRRLHWQLLGMVALVVALAGLGAGFGLARVSGNTDAYAALVDTTIRAAKQADDVNAQFISRHKVLKDIYLFDTDAQKVQTYSGEVAAWDLKVSDGLARLQQDPALRPDEKLLVDTALQALTSYHLVSGSAIERIHAGGDPYQTQQDAALLTAGKDRPVSAALSELSDRLNSRVQAESIGLHAESQRTEIAAVGVMVAVLLLGLALATWVARGITRTAAEIETAARGLASGDLDQKVNIWSRDELGRMAAAFRQMMTYHQRMATIADAIAAGDLTADVQPQSRRDRLGIALQGMIGNLRSLVAGLEERSAQAEQLVEELNAQIGDRKEVEVALRASEERFRKQYKGIPVPTYSWLQVGDDFVLEDYNDAAESVTDGHVRGWLGTLASTCYADKPQVVADLRACVAQQHTLRQEMLYRYRRTGQERQLAVTYVFVPPQSVMSHIEDITDARQAEQQREALAQSEKLRALGQMASGIAHDLNQSLMLVASYSDLAHQALLQDPPNLAEVEDLVTTTTQAALDGGETVKRLLMFTRAAPEHDGKQVDLSSIVREAAQLTAPRWRDAAQAEGRPISLHIDAEQHPTIHGSAARLRELMTNLIFNAVDALPTGGTIRLRVLAQDGQGIVEVVDSGVGMSAEVQARVFEPFFTTKGESGTGLGLAMVFGIVEQHYGHIEVHSAPGDGTTFRIAFDLSEALAEAEAPSIRVGPLEPIPLRVLVVDDEPMMTKAVVRMLRPAGHQVRSAGSGEEALELLAADTFDLVVSDMGMGAGMNGWDLADTVRRRWPGVRFLLATGWGAAIDPAEARAKGVEAVLSKPYRPSELLEALVRTDAAA